MVQSNRRKSTEELGPLAKENLLDMEEGVPLEIQGEEDPLEIREDPLEMESHQQFPYLHRSRQSSYLVQNKHVL